MAGTGDRIGDGEASATTATEFSGYAINISTMVGLFFAISVSSGSSCGGYGCGDCGSFGSSSGGGLWM